MYKNKRKFMLDRGIMRYENLAKSKRTIEKAVEMG
jgi:hypothetical protein